MEFSAAVEVGKVKVAVPQEVVVRLSWLVHEHWSDCGSACAGGQHAACRWCAQVYTHVQRELCR